MGSAEMRDGAKAVRGSSHNVKRRNVWYNGDLYTQAEHRLVLRNMTKGDIMKKAMRKEGESRCIES